MRRLSLFTSIVILILVIAVPSLLGRAQEPPAPPTAVVGQPASAAVPQPSTGPDVQVQVWFPREGKLRPMPLEGFLVGVVAGEMKPEFAAEALKAQFIAARTYTVYHMHRYGGQGCPAEPQADICAAPETGMAYTSLADMTERQGAAAAQQAWQRLTQMGQATRGEILTYQGQPINALFHSSSGTSTASAAEYFGQEIPYLQSVADPYGKEAPGYTQARTFTREEVAAKLPGVALPASTGASLVTIAGRAPDGRVTEVKAGDTTLSARQFREKLGLRSTQFTLAWQGGKLTITTNGYGHGVGLSQWGANGMAAHGATFAEILYHYYQGVKLETLRTS